MRRAAKRDISEPEIVNTLEQCGFTVHRVSQEGMPDLLCGFRGKTYLIECKTGKGKLTVGQARFIETWRGHPVQVLRDAQEAMDWCVHIAGGGDGFK